MRALSATLTLTAALLAGCGSSDLTIPVQVLADGQPESFDRHRGEPCSAADVRAGMQVLAYDGKGTVVGKATLSDGTLTTDVAATDVVVLCAFDVKVPVKAADFYRFEVPGGTSRTITAAEAAKTKGEVIFVHLPGG